MSVIDSIHAAARVSGATIVLPEGDEPRIRDAAVEATRLGLARIVLIGGEAARQTARAHSDIVARDALCATRIDAFAAQFLQLRKGKCPDMAAARSAMRSPLAQAAMMVRLGEADGTVGGAVATTADTVRAALRIIGPADGVEVVSSSFLMLFPAPFDRPVVFADCGLVLQPNAEELADIAISAAGTLRALTGEVPRIAVLSFSTHGSVAETAHESIGRIRTAVALVRQRRPDLMIEGEMQFDAALLPEVARSKAPFSVLDGGANVFVFPSLSAGNIGYKIAQRLGRAAALGPILQGLARPANDLSRGCSAEDVLNIIAITAAQVALQNDLAPKAETAGQMT